MRSDVFVLARWRSLAVLSVVLLVLSASFPVLGSVSITANTYIGPNDTTYDGEALTISGCTVTIDGSHSFDSLELVSNSSLAHSFYTGNASQRIDLAIAGDLTVEAGSSITGSYRGYPRNQGPGAGGPGGYIGTDAGSGGFGGNGGSSTGPGGVAYGSYSQPSDWGSGGHDLFFPGGAGGGRIRLQVGGRLRVDGVIACDGDWPGVHPWGQAGCGSGGSIWISAGTLEGSGSIHADGGGTPQLATGGGGGRVAIYCADDSFTGSITARGGHTYYPGGAGTVYRKLESSPTGTLLLDNGGSAGAPTPIFTTVQTDLVLRGGAQAHVQPGSVIRTLDCQASTLAAPAGQTCAVSVSGDLTLANGSRVLGNASLSAGGNMTVSADSKFNAYCAGYAPGEGPGYGGSGGYIGTDAGAGSHGGFGAPGLNPGGSTYGSLTQPSEPGSGGHNHFTAGGYGGGAVRISAGGTLALDGVIDCNGGPSIINGWGSSGAGSGGSVWITAGELTGSGTITANGGGGGVGGGGGRIALHYNTSSFNGIVTAYGGDATRPGGAGTIYRKASSDPLGSVSIDNGGLSGGWTPLPASGGYDLKLAGKAIGSSSDAINVRDFYLQNAELRHPEGAVAHRVRLNVSGDLEIADSGKITGSCQIYVMGNASIDNGTAISADAFGYGTGYGQGPGGDGSWYGGGAGHGAPGGALGDGKGGRAYGSATNPIDPGSGGGGVPNVGPGGNGGGVIRLDVSGMLRIDGQVSANAADGRHGDWGLSGGGSGGSVLISCGALSGSGSITTRGGFPQGAGGRIAIYTVSNSFTGQAVSEGRGENDGTVYWGTGSLPAISEFVQKYYMAGDPVFLPGPAAVVGNPRPVFSLAGSPPGMSVNPVTGDVSWPESILPGPAWDGNVMLVARNAYGQVERPLNLYPMPKQLPDGAAVRIGRVVVTASLPDSVYLQPVGEPWGIRLQSQAGLPVWTVGDIVDAGGTMQTRNTGERYVLASLQPSPVGHMSGLLPALLGMRDLGGGSLLDGKGSLMQAGVAGGLGVNNIGLLVKVWGRVVSADSTSFLIDDGSGVTARVAIRQGMIPPPAGQLVAVTGVCSLQPGSGRLLLVRGAADIVALE